jgi:hypothetical protein
LLIEGVPWVPAIIHFRFGDGPDGRRQIGSTPAGGAAGSTHRSREPPHPSTVVNRPDEGVTIPRGVVHRPRAHGRTVLLMIEPATVNPTGND